MFGQHPGDLYRMTSNANGESPCQRIYVQEIQILIRKLRAGK